jgi:hypothetical protein
VLYDAPFFINIEAPGTPSMISEKCMALRSVVAGTRGGMQHDVDMQHPPHTLLGKGLQPVMITTACCLMCSQSTSHANAIYEHSATQHVHQKAAGMFAQLAGYEVVGVLPCPLAATAAARAMPA